MAKVNLGRIRTVFKGEWVAGAYEVDDVVLYAGSSYTCISNSTSSDDPTDTAFWVQSAGGLEFTGTWDTSTTYKVNQIATFNGSTYIAITAHSATQPTSTGQTDWAVIAEAFKFEGAWDVSTAYQTNDIATFTGSTYIALVDHTGTEPEVGGNASWAVFAGGFQYEGAWDISTAYQANDIVAFSGSTYIALTAHVGVQPLISGNASWAVFAGGFQYEGAWDISTTYHTNDIVTLNGSTYIAISDHTGTQPEAAGNAAWVLFASGGDIADQSGQSGKVLSTDGTSTSWVSGNPDQSGQANKVLKTDGTSTSWGNITVTELGVTDGTDGQVLSTNGGGIWSFVDQQGEDGNFGEPQTFTCACRYYSSAQCTCVPDSATTMMIEAWGQGGGGGGSCCCMWGLYGGQGGDYSMKKWDVSSYGNITVCGCACCCECNNPVCTGHQGQFTRYCICGTGGGSSTSALQCCYCTSGGHCGLNNCFWGQSNTCSCGGGRAYYNGKGDGSQQGPGKRGGADCNWVCDNFCTDSAGASDWCKCESSNPGCNTQGCCYYDLYVKGKCGSSPLRTCSATTAHLLGIGGASFKGGAEQDQTCSMGNWAYCGMCGNFPGGGGHGSGACGGGCCLGGRGHQGAWIVSWE